MGKSARQLLPSRPGYYPPLAVHHSAVKPPSWHLVDPPLGLAQAAGLEEGEEEVSEARLGAHGAPWVRVESGR